MVDYRYPETKPSPRHFGSYVGHCIVQVYIQCRLIIPLTNRTELLPLPSDIMLDPREALFNWVQVGGVRWKIENLDASESC
jgi:hypothetical protein